MERTVYTRATADKRNVNLAITGLKKAGTVYKHHRTDYNDIDDRYRHEIDKRHVLQASPLRPLHPSD